MPDALLAAVVVLAIASIAVVVSVRFGIVVAPRVGRALDRMDSDEEPGDRAD